MVPKLLNLAKDLIDIAGVFSQYPTLEQQRISFARSIAHLAESIDPLICVQLENRTAGPRLSEPHVGDFQLRWTRICVHI